MTNSWFDIGILRLLTAWDAETSTSLLTIVYDEVFWDAWDVHDCLRYDYDTETIINKREKTWMSLQ